MKILLFFALLPALCSAVAVQVVSLVPPVITNVNPAHYDLTGAGGGYSTFTIHVNHVPADSAIGSLRVLYRVKVRTAGDGGAPRLVYEGVSNAFKVGAGVPNPVVISSNQFLQSKNSSTLFSRNHSVNYQDNAYGKDVANRAFASGTLPTGDLVYEVVLQSSSVSVEQVNARPRSYESRFTEVSSDQLSLQIINASTVTPQAPGSLYQAGQQAAAIGVDRPLFTWSSDLFPGIYGGSPVFEVALFAVEPRRSLADNLRRPLWTTQTVQPMVQYPASAPKLDAGKTYLWQVNGLLQGVVNTKVASEVFAFRLPNASMGNVQARQTIESLRTALVGTPYQHLPDQLLGFDADFLAEIEGRPVNPADVEEFLRRLRSGNLWVESVVVR